MSLDFYIVEDGNFVDDEELFGANYTHNVTPMWKKAGVYLALYMSSGKQPKDIIRELEIGLKHMQDNPEEYKLLNPENGWGDYETAMEFLNKVIEACKQYSNGTIVISK